MTPVLFGAAYYPEYQSPSRLAEDLRLMRDAGFTAIRVGESTWSDWEPDDGVFDLDRMQPVLDAAGAHGIGVVLGTPTYAVPPWLARKYPEIAAERATGTPIGWGSRQEMDFTHPAFRVHAERVIRAVIGRYHDHPAVIGFQVDNEPGLELLHNRGVFEAFKEHLRAGYGDLETLNTEWGLSFWSHRLTSWDELWTPDNNAQPQYDLAWRRFQAKLVTEYIAWQAAIVREIAGTRKFVTSCLAYSRPAVEDRDISDQIDVTAGNLYYAAQDALAHPEETTESGWYDHGVWNLFFQADRTYSSGQARFLVTETSAGAIGSSSMNYPPYDGQLRQAAWAMIARGAAMLEYWNWNTLNIGAETHWGGILPHDHQPGRIYREVAEIGAELRRVADQFDGFVPDAAVGLLWSTQSMWAMEHDPALADGRSPRPDSYRSILQTFYRHAFTAGLPVRIVHDTQLVRDGSPMRTPDELTHELPVLIVPALYVAGDGVADWLADYAREGGHLVIGPRSGYADREARADLRRQPAGLAEAAGAGYQEFSNLEHPVLIEPADGFELNGPGRACGWIDCYQVSDPDTVTLATYRHPFFARFAALTTRPCGAGRITSVGTIPDEVFGGSLMRWLVPTAPGWASAAGGPITVHSGRNASGRRVHIVHNWGWLEHPFQLPGEALDLVSAEVLGRGDEVRLGAWDVRVFAER